MAAHMISAKNEKSQGCQQHLYIYAAYALNVGEQCRVQHIFQIA